MNKKQIKSYLVNQIRNKLNSYSRESKHMPFHYRLLGKDRIALYSFIHSVNTMLGQSIFEQIAKMIALDNKAINSENHYILKGFISKSAVLKIDEIERELKIGKTSNKIKEIELIKKVSTKGDFGKPLKKIIDLFVETKNTECYFEIKTAKPNIDVVKATKKKLLEWVAVRNSNNSLQKQIKTIMAIPYNPYEPQPYERWTLQGLFDLKEELLVGKEFWDLLGGKDTYEKLLDVFEEVGLELYDEIDKKMKNI